MIYMGSKLNLAKRIIPLMPVEGRVFVEPFAGGLNLTAQVKNAASRVANDINPYVIALFSALQEGWEPGFVSKEDYKFFRSGRGEPHEIGYAGFVCSYSGKWFGGYVGRHQNGRDYQGEQRRALMRQVPHILGVDLYCGSYRDLEIPDGAVVYCDPPYAATTKYRDDFNSRRFWRWAKRLSRRCDVFVSEYSAPDFATEILNVPVSVRLGSGPGRAATEKLFQL